jgi:predicted O-methyltransferase YrrM
MDTLTTAPLAPLLDRLFAEAEAPASARARAALSASSVESDYRNFYAAAKDAYLAVSRDTARLLYMLVRSSGARSVVEFGTSFGISTLHLAAGLRDNGGGRIITTEFEPSKAARAHANFAAGGLSDLIELREGDALETLAHDLPAQIDVALLDGAKGLYRAVLGLLEGHLRPGALLVADNADWTPEYLQHVRSATNGYVSVPFADDVELSMRIG